MTPTDRPASSLSMDARLAGWTVSLILHGTLAFGTFLFLQQVKLAPQQTPFQWDVAMVEPATHATAPPAPTANQSSPQAPIAESAVKPSSTKNQPTVSSSETPSPIEQRRIADPPPSQPVAEQIPHSVTEQVPLKRTVETMDHPITQTEPITPIPPPAPPAPQQSASAAAIQPPPSLHDSEQPEPAPHTPAMSTPFQPTSSAPVDPALAAHDNADIVPKDSSPPQQVAALGPSNPPKSTKADYGWLANLMAKWIGDLDKRYPAVLRTDGVTGRVTVTALLHQNGTLTDVRVVKSSGNALLDQVAVEDITNGPPVNLSHPLNRPHMPVKFSIVYDLKNAR